MDERHFEQGMSHNEAKAYDVGSSGMSEEQKAKMNEHYAGLSDRPDYDGKLTFYEVTKWSSEGSGNSLFVDGSKIDLSPLITKDFEDNKSRSINFFKGKYQNFETGPVYGHIQVTLLNSEGVVRLGLENTLLDKHDFSNPIYKSINDWLYPGTPKDFEIFCAPCYSKIKTK